MTRCITVSDDQLQYGLPIGRGFRILGKSVGIAYGRHLGEVGEVVGDGQHAIVAQIVQHVRVAQRVQYVDPFELCHVRAKLAEILRKPRIPAINNVE